MSAPPTKERVKRWGCTNGGAQFCQGCFQMEEESDYVDGNYVLAEDYDALVNIFNLWDAGMFGTKEAMDKFRQEIRRE